MYQYLSPALGSLMRRALRGRAGRLIAAMLLAGVAVIGLGASANAQPTSGAAVVPFVGGSFHAIKNSGNGLCLEPMGLSTAAEALIVQAPCVLSGTESLAQGWQFTRVGTNHYTFLNQLSGLCLDAVGLYNGAGLHPVALRPNQQPGVQHGYLAARGRQDRVADPLQRQRVLHRRTRRIQPGRVADPALPVQRHPGADLAERLLTFSTRIWPVRTLAPGGSPPPGAP